MNQVSFYENHLPDAEIFESDTADLDSDSDISEALAGCANTEPNPLEKMLRTERTTEAQSQRGLGDQEKARLRALHPSKSGREHQSNVTLRAYFAHVEAEQSQSYPKTFWGKILSRAHVDGVLHDVVQFPQDPGTRPLSRPL